MRSRTIQTSALLFAILVIGCGGDDGGTPPPDCTPEAAVRLTTDPAFDEDPVWSPDGSKIAFTSERGGDYKVWIMPSIGGVQQQLTSDGSSADWSPDGQWIVFDSNRSGMSQIYRISTTARSAEKDDDGAIQLTDALEGAYGPRWVGEWVYFWVGYVEPSLWRMHGIDSADADEWWHAAPEVYSPAWSPDGTKVVFYGNHEDATANSYIYLANSDLTGRIKLTNVTGEVEDRHPVWSPDGDYIVFTRWRAGMEDQCIFIMPAMGESAEAPASQLTWNDDRDNSPSWSPCGDRIAFTGDRGDNGDIYVMSACGEPEPAR